jgi:hypothetical protein
MNTVELGTIDHPFRMIDDAFRELFNRKQLFSKRTNKDFNITIYLKNSLDDGNNIQTNNHNIFAIDMPLIVVNMNLEIR